jgi:hypothetical protein
MGGFSVQAGQILAWWRTGEEAMADFLKESSAVVTTTLKVPEKATEADELRAYREFVESVAKAADGSMIFNRSPAHAAAVVAALLKGATKEVDIITGELFEPVYGATDVIDAAVVFLNEHPDGRIRVLSERPIADNHPLLAALETAGVRAKIVKKQIPSDAAVATPFHFAVADAQSFRFEANKDVMEAVVQFGKKDAGARLSSIFNKMWTAV